MKLIINKFPPIVQKCELDLSKKVTIFVGKNNAGKTYISQLVWGIHNFDNHKDKYFSYMHDAFQIEPIVEVITKDEITKKINQEYLNKISTNYSLFLGDKVVEKIFKKKFDTNFEIIFDEDDCYKKHINGGIVIDNYEVSYSKEPNSQDFKIIIKNKNINLIQEEDVEFPYDLINKYLEGVVIQTMVNNNPVYMPSTRLFLPSFYKYIYTMEKDLKDTMLENFSKLNQENKSFFASSYTLPIDKLMSKLVFDLDMPNSNNQFLQKLSEIIEGEIVIDKLEEISMADISYVHKSGKKLPMHLSSSMVNQLVTIFLYFKYWSGANNNFLLLDEPEMNLHPTKKLELLELLLSFASTNKLLLATHSSSIAKSIINYIHFFDLKDKKNNEEIGKFVFDNDLQMNTDINLKSNDIAIYYFNGKTIVSYKKDNDSNIHFGTFTDIEKLQNRQYDYILEALEE